MSELGFFLDILILSLTFILIIKYREKIAKLFKKIPLSKFPVYLISSIPFMIFEENINCAPSGCVLIPWTIPFLLLFVLVLGLIVRRLKPKSLKYPLIGFLIFGILWEVLIGGLRNQLTIIGPALYSFMIFWVALSYAYIVIVPLTILLNQKK
tara:strand:+ start:2407 stop:2865 length:459 start_codon:yes stop_codon:yes gene_type:complete